uniref:Putative TetR family regulatory protein n=1 Tax=uncultured bacterium UPO53 TaxID=1776978 RepID=A0A126SYG2_9BACT|nr:putative TetR family regulatory protein [uncultured bacterium UPO53]
MQALFIFGKPSLLVSVFPASAVRRCRWPRLAVILAPSPGIMESGNRMQQATVTYQGRKTARQSSEQRRLAILHAALRVLVRDGVRGVRHRAVAKEAQVPLSATTYYFKDIHDLLADAFTLFANETVQTFIDPFWSRANEWIHSYPANTRKHPELMAEVIEHMSVMGAHHILMRVSEHREHLVVEHALWYAALVDERMRDLALQHGSRLLTNFTQIMEYVGAEEVDLGAKSLLATVRRLEYEGMLGSPEFTHEKVRDTLRHQIRAVLSA